MLIWNVALDCDQDSLHDAQTLSSSKKSHHANKILMYLDFYVRIFSQNHYIAVIMITMASQITSLTVVYSIVYSGADQRKHQSSASLAFVRGSHRYWWIPHTNGQQRGKCFHLMTSSCQYISPSGDWADQICSLIWLKSENRGKIVVNTV